jgi:PAS domain S-box-containing protein
MRQASDIDMSGLLKSAERAILDYHAPAYVVVNDKADVLYASAHTGKYLQVPQDAPHVNVLRMARPEIRRGVRVTFHKASDQRQVVVCDPLYVYVNGECQHVRLTIRPLAQRGAKAGLMLVIFEEIGLPFPAVQGKQHTPFPQEAEPIIQQLEDQFTRTQENLQDTIEELGISNQDLGASNEERTMINEELWVAKEELVSSQAELNAINAELHDKIEALTRVNEDIKNYLDSTHIATMFLDLHACIKSFSPAITDIFRVLHSDIGRPITDIAPRLVYDHVQQDIASVLQTQAPVEKQLHTPAGDWYMMRILPYRRLDNAIDGVVMTFVNVSALKNAEEKISQLNRDLQHQVAELETLLELAPIGIAISNDPAGHSIRVNRRGYEILGIPLGSNAFTSASTGKDAPFVIYRDDQEVPPEDLPIQRAGRSGTPVRNEEYRVVRQDGQAVSMVMSAAPLYDTHGQAVGAIGAFGDITLRKQTQQELERHARQQSVVVQLGLRALADVAVSAVMDEAVALVAETLEVEYCKVLELLPDGMALRLRAGVGWQEGLVGQAIVATTDDSQAGFTLLSNAPVIVEELRTEMRSHGPSLLLDHGVVSGMSVVIHGPSRPYGVLGAYTTTRRTFTTDDINFLQSVAHVLTTALHREHIEKNLRQEQLQQAERLASIGTLATGVAHELNNPLNTIMLSAEYAQSLHNGQAATGLDDLESTLNDIVYEAQRCGAIVKNLLRLARNEPLQKEPHDLNEIVRRTVDLAEHYFPQAHMVLRCDLTEDLPDVVLNATEIRQVLVNLLQNALDAAGEEGQVTIRTRSNQTSVQLIVQDNGPGIPAEHIPHIFDPFYSTRRHEGGMGLGLSIVYAIVTDHRGSIRIQTASGQGTAFVITLPPAAEERHEHDEGSRC